MKRNERLNQRRWNDGNKLEMTAKKVKWWKQMGNEANEGEIIKISEKLHKRR